MAKTIKKSYTTSEPKKAVAPLYKVGDPIRIVGTPFDCIILAIHRDRINYKKKLFLYDLQLPFSSNRTEDDSNLADTALPDANPHLLPSIPDQRTIRVCEDQIFPPWHILHKLIVEWMAVARRINLLCLAIGRLSAKHGGTGKWEVFFGRCQNDIEDSMKKNPNYSFRFFIELDHLTEIHEQEIRISHWTV